MKHTRAIAIVAACATLAACNLDAPLGPRDEHGTMRVATNGVSATAIGETVSIAASVMGPAGDWMEDADIHWEMSNPDVLAPMGDGRFRVIRDGEVKVAAVWTKDPSVRATVAVTVDAGLLASACITKSDQATTLATSCASTRVTVHVAPTTSFSVGADAPVAVRMPTSSGARR